MIVCSSYTAYYVIVKALPRVCMKNTARGSVEWLIQAECCIYHETPQKAVFHTHKHRQCFKWYIVLDPQSIDAYSGHVVVTAAKRITSFA